MPSSSVPETRLKVPKPVTWFVLRLRKLSPPPCRRPETLSVMCAVTVIVCADVEGSTEAGNEMDASTGGVVSVPELVTWTDDGSPAAVRSDGGRDTLLPATSLRFTDPIVHVPGSM